MTNLVPAPMKFLIPLPDHPFYLWQALVQMHALDGKDAQWLIYCPSGKPSGLLAAIMQSGIARIAAWPDWQRDGAYHAAMKPWLVGKWLTAENYEGSVCVIDPDVIPTGNMLPIAQVGTLTGTDTDSYTGPAYLQSKGCWEALCALVGVDPDLASQMPGIGAQYVFRGLCGAWWEDVAQLSIKAFHLLSEHPSDVQVWCAEMYATQLAAIRDGLEVLSDPWMEMVWADGDAQGWQSAAFFHDAGVPEPREGIFCKGSWQHSPFGRNVPPVDPSTAGFHYLELIRETEERWPHLTQLFA